VGLKPAPFYFSFDLFCKNALFKNFYFVADLSIIFGFLASIRFVIF